MRQIASQAVCVLAVAVVMVPAAETDVKNVEARCALYAEACKLGNFLRWLARPRSVKHWSLTRLHRLKS